MRKIKERFWRLVSSLRFANAVHDVTLIGGMTFVVVYFYWLLWRP